MRTLLGLLFAALALPIFAQSRNYFLEARCDALCQQEGKECKDKCYNDPPDKPGRCGNQKYPFYENCVNECNFHKDCSNFDLCCSNACGGKTCQTPVDLDSISELSEIPTNVTISRSLDLNCLTIDWSHSGESWYIVEIRESSSTWDTGRKSIRSSHPIKIPITTGGEYVARVAAVNSIGSRGYSQQSSPYTHHFGEARQPNMPEHLRFKGVLKNGSISGLLSWQVPRNDQPISRYVVLWSQLLTDENTPPHKVSKEVHRKTIPHGKTCIRIKNLKPNSQYTFSVQAKVINSKTKISSKRAILNYDTSNFNSSNHADTKQKPKPKLTVQCHLVNKSGNQSAEISWKSRKKTKYSLSWESLCNKKTSAVTLNNSSHKIPNLERNCVYNVLVKEIKECKKRRRVGKATFKTN